MRSADPSVVVAAVHAVADCAGPQAVQHLAGILSHRNGQVDGGSGGARMVRAPGMAEPLRRLLKDELWDVRRAAAEALGRIQDPEAIEALTRSLDDKDADVRKATAVSLGMLGDRRAIAALGYGVKGWKQRRCGGSPQLRSPRIDQK